MFTKKTLTQVKKFINSRVLDSHDGEEIFQDTLISACESFPTFEGKSSFETWLCSIARHEIADFYRKKRIKTLLFSHLPFLESLADQALGPQEKVIEEELKNKVKRVLGNLSEGYQVVLRLKYIDGDSMIQIAKKLGLSSKAVESRLTRARLAFREAWTDDSYKRQETNDKLQEQNPKDPFF